jgi:hypothetical protein
MTTTHTASNPFALMMNPEAVFEALARSDRLSRLKSRVCRPLDKPLIAHADAEDQLDGAQDEHMNGVSLTDC